MRQVRAELWTKWRGLVSEQSQSGQTVKAFCHDRGLLDSLFYDWKKRLREGEAVKFVEVKLKERGEQRKPSPERYLAIEIRLNKGRSLLVEPGFDANHLRALLAVLETEACSGFRVCRPWIMLTDRASGLQQMRLTCAAECDMKLIQRLFDMNSS